MNGRSEAFALAGERWWVALLLCCTLAFLAFSSAAPAAVAPAAAPEPKPAAQQPVPHDPLARTTPYSTVIGFLRAADKSDYELASRYLEGNQSAKKKEELARDLKIVLNRGLNIDLRDLSKAPEGRLDDGLGVYLEKVGTAIYGSESLDVVLRRSTKSDAPPIWLFSSETLSRVTVATEEFDLAWGEAIWPESFREINVFSYPLFLIVNKFLIFPVMLGIAWLLTRWLLAFLGPRVRRWSAEYDERGLTQIKWLLFLLVFSVMLRALSAGAVTVAGRIVFATIASVLMILAVTGLVVHLTRLVTRLKILHLQRSGMPSSIAAVELLSWLVMAVFATAGLFLMLRSLGFEVTLAVAGLGVGGIAIAFAAQKTIENLFGTVTIVADKAIHVGDQCQAGTTEGGVESIGLRSTRIRTADRAVVTIPNGQLAGMTIGNLSQRDKFLFRHNIRLRYDTTAEQLRRVLADIRELMSAHPKLEPSSIRTRLVRFGEYSLDLETFAYVETRDWQAFLEIQEDLLLRILDIIEASGTATALPFPAESTAGESGQDSSRPAPVRQGESG